MIYRPERLLEMRGTLFADFFEAIRQTTRCLFLHALEPLANGLGNRGVQTLARQIGKLPCQRENFWIIHVRPLLGALVRC